MEPEEFDMLSALCNKLGAAANCKQYPEVHVDHCTYDYVRLRMGKYNTNWNNEDLRAGLIWNGTKLVRSL